MQAIETRTTAPFISMKTIGTRATLRVKRSAYDWTAQSIARASKLPENTVSAQSHALGIANCEPLLVCLDSLLKYATSYRSHYDRPLCEDGCLADYWLEAIKGVRKLLNGDGAVALSMHITTDSKDNGVLEGLFWDALEAAGYTEDTADL